MRLFLLRSLWTNGFDLKAAIADCRSGAFQGIEGPVPGAPRARQVFRRRLRDAGLPFVAEIALGGGYVPAPASSPARQLAEFRRRAEAAAACSPLFLTVLAGSDAWPLPQAVEFLGEIMAVARGAGLAAAIETHRSRPTYSPWSTQELMRQLPELRLTCDFSHWCCVCERPVLDEQPGLLMAVADRALHVHARIGYDQGPQAPHPGAPAYAAYLAAHERWWDAVWTAQQRMGRDATTATPEFGPDGYLQSHPFSGVPAGELDSINRWMAARLRRRFSHTSEEIPRHAA